MSVINYFDANQDYTLENDAVLLRSLNKNDFNYLSSFAINESEICKFSLVAVQGEESLKNYIENAVEQRSKGTEYPFIVFDKRTGQYAGCTRFYDIQLVN